MFLQFSQSPASFSRFLDLLGPVRMHSDPFGCIRMYLEAFGRTQKIWEILVRKMRKIGIEIFGDGPNDAQKHFGNDSPSQLDQFCPKIVEIGAILTIFRPFEVFAKMFHFPGLWTTVNHIGKIMRELNPQPHIKKNRCRNRFQGKLPFSEN